MAAPKTLQEAIVYFSNPDNCHSFMMDMRWPDGIVRCPRCKSEHVGYLEKARQWKCYEKHDRPKFTLKVGTIFEDSPLGLDKWLPAVWLVTNCKNGVSSYELHRDLGVTQKTAWFMLHRIRLAMQEADGEYGFEKFAGEVEADETFVGGKMPNMHRRSKRRISAEKDGTWGKTIVLGLLERESGKVRAAVAPSRRKRPIHEHIEKNVAAGSKLYTDDHMSYEDLPKEFTREFVDHIEKYVNGRVHTNGLENFWSLLKRSLKGTYVSVDPAHLFRYVDEQAFRYNNRKEMNDADRFEAVLSQITEKRLKYSELIGKEAETKPVA